MYEDEQPITPPSEAVAPPSAVPGAENAIPPTSEYGALPATESITPPALSTMAPLDPNTNPDDLPKPEKEAYPDILAPPTTPGTISPIAADTVLPLPSDYSAQLPSENAVDALPTSPDAYSTQGAADNPDLDSMFGSSHSLSFYIMLVTIVSIN